MNFFGDHIGFDHKASVAAVASAPPVPPTSVPYVLPSIPIVPQALTPTPSVAPVAQTGTPVASTNKFVSILQSIGAKFQIGVNKAIAFEASALPIEQDVANVVTLADPPVGATLEGLVGVIGNVEQIAVALNASSGTGPQKLIASVPGIEQAILNDPIFKGKTISDLPKWTAGITNIASSLADLLNSVESATAPVTSAAAIAAPVAKTVAASPAGTVTA